MSVLYEISGGAPIHGEVQILGAKNFATKAMVASLLTEDETTLLNVPNIGDIDITTDMIRGIGGKVNFKGDVLTISSQGVSSSIPLPDSGSNRIPILLMSALLHRFDEVSAPFVSGCDIGGRPVDFHLEAMKMFGASVTITDNGYHAAKHGRLQACHYKLPYPSVGATESCLMLGVLAEGTSLIQNIAIEPEIMALITMLNAMGAKIQIGINRTVTIQGVLKLSGTVYEVLGDRIEAVSWACLAAATNGEIITHGINPEILVNFFGYFNEVGGGVEIIDGKTIKFYRKRNLKPIAIETDVYPGFSTDWQQPFTVLLTQAEGISVIHETVYENRFGYADTLNKLGADIQLESYCLGSANCRFKGKDHKHSAIIRGKSNLCSINEVISIPDLRAGLAYIMATCLSNGKSIVKNIELLERGYGSLKDRAPFLNINLLED